MNRADRLRRKAMEAGRISASATITSDKVGTTHGHCGIPKRDRGRQWVLNGIG
jgi:hypothetical protein